MKLLEYLRGLTNYPLSEEALTSILTRRGANEHTTYDDKTQSILATADLYHWLSTAPDLSQGGQSYSLTDATRDTYRRRANGLYRLAGEPQSIIEEQPRYGYKGEKL